MASWLMRMASSPGTPSRKRLAICCGLHRRACLSPCRRPVQAAAGPAIAVPPGVATAPASRSCTYARSAGLAASFARFGRRAGRSACQCVVMARYASSPPRVAALRRSDAVRPTARDRGRRPPQPARNLLHAQALRPQQRDLLPPSKRKTASRKRLGRARQVRRRHPARRSEPAEPNRLRYPGLHRRVLARQSCRNKRPDLPQQTPRAAIASPFNPVLRQPFESTRR